MFIDSDNALGILAESTLLVLGAAMVGSGICLRSYLSITDVTLRVLDLVWICASCISLCLSLSQVLSISKEADRSFLTRIVSKEKHAALDLLGVLQRSCQTGSQSGPICGWGGRIASELDSERLPPSSEVQEVCPRPVTEGHPLFWLCASLNTISYIRDYEIVPHKEADNTSTTIRFLLLIAIVVAIGARVPKSIFDVFLKQAAERRRKFATLTP